MKVRGVRERRPSPPSDPDKLEALREGERMRSIWAKRNCGIGQCTRSRGECGAGLRRMGFLPPPTPLPRAQARIVNLHSSGLLARFWRSLSWSW